MKCPMQNKIKLQTFIITHFRLLESQILIKFSTFRYHSYKH